MTRNYIQPGDVIEAVAPSGGIVAGQGMQIGLRLFGVALETKAEGETVQLKRSGMFTMAKTSALVINAGDVLYWDATNKVVNKTTSGQIAVGVAYSGAANPSPTVVMLVGVDTGAGT
jgi:predicted RecA/RadA family phage recombinase